MVMTCKHCCSFEGWLYCCKFVDSEAPIYIGIIECTKQTRCYEEEKA